MSITVLTVSALLIAGAIFMGFKMGLKTKQQTVEESQPTQQESLDYIETGYYYPTSDGINRPVRLSFKGSFYILRINSVSGKEYKFYMTEKWQEKLKEAYIKDNPNQTIFK